MLEHNDEIFCSFPFYTLQPKAASTCTVADVRVIYPTDVSVQPVEVVPRGTEPASERYAFR